MSMHWTQEQPTVFTVVVLRKVNNCVRKDHFAFIKHDVPFVEICSNIIHNYYADINMPVLTDIEFNDGLAASSSLLQLLLNMHVARYQLPESFLKHAMESQSQLDLVEL